VFATCPAVARPFRQYEQALISSRRRKNQVKFLQDCLQEQVSPPSFGQYLYSARLGIPFSDCERNRLCDSIRCAKLDVDDAFFKVRKSLRLLREVTPAQFVDDLLAIAARRSSLESERHQRSLRNKLNNLCSRSAWCKFSLTDSVVNLSSYSLSRYETELLGFGLSFATKPSVNHCLDYIKGLDSFIAKQNKSSIKDLSYLKGVMLNPILDLFDNFKGLPRRYLLATRSLKRNPDILITKADKGNNVVILDRSDYIRKAHSLLHDNSTYQKLRSNPYSTVIESFRKNLKRIAAKCPDPKFFDRFRTINPSIPYFYGLPKTHKQGVPLRPIISSCNSVTRPLDSWLASVLSPFMGSFSNSHIKHSMDFMDKVRNLPTHDKKLVSFDVDSLFTNVPLDDVLDFLERKLSSFHQRIPIPVNYFIDLIRLCVTNNVFTFDGDFYKQIHGIAMGSSLSPVLANLYMEMFESELLPSILPPDTIWFRYVDDIFSMWQMNRSDFDDFLNRLNNLARTINFKVEWEDSGKLPFLDVLLSNVNGSLKFSVYRKPTHTANYLHFFSNHPLYIKKSVVSSMFLRAYRICDNEFIDRELDFIFETFSKLGYPRFFLNQAHSSAKWKFYNHSRNMQQESAKNLLIIPYNPSLDEKRRMFKGAGIDIVFTYPNTLRNTLIRHNITSSAIETSPGIYTIPCKDCPKFYIGETGRTFEKRINEHRRDVRYARESNACFIHLRDEGHQLNWKDAKLIHRSSNSYERKIIEALLIRKLPNFNLSAGQWGLDDITSSLVSKAFPRLFDLDPPPET